MTVQKRIVRRLFLLAVITVGFGCHRANLEKKEDERTFMSQSTVKFTDTESQLLRERRIAIFRNKIILEAQPPITDAQLADLEKRIDGKVPPELLALWKTSFGGELDYDYEVSFADHLYSASFTELFYPGSKHYRDLNGWIEHEVELLGEVAEERGKPAPVLSPVIPFGGFEYLERFHVSLEPGEYGTVLVYAQGIPWKGSLNEDSVAVTAGNIAELFDQLALNTDPFDEVSDEYSSGKNMVAKIREFEIDHPELAAKLKKLVRSGIVDWRSIVENADFGRKLSAQESKALRIALEYAVDRKDVSIIDLLHQKGASFHVPLHGQQGVLHYALRRKAQEIVERLLDLRVEFDDAPIIHASGCSDELLLRLIEYGAIFDEEAIYTAAETGAINAAIALANSEQVARFEGISRVAASASKRAARHDEDAVKVESGKLSSYLTADQYREQAKALREFADGIRRYN